MTQVIQPHLTAIRDACSRHSVKSLDLFGRLPVMTLIANPAISTSPWSSKTSLPRHTPTPISAYSRVSKDILQAPVDLVEWDAVKNPFFRQALEESRVQLYAA